jgi:hypothetical protein
MSNVKREPSADKRKNNKGKPTAAQRAHNTVVRTHGKSSVKSTRLLTAAERKARRQKLRDDVTEFLNNGGVITKC